MQTCVQDLFDINFSWYVRYDTVSTYDTLILSLPLNHVSIFVELDCMILPPFLNIRCFSFVKQIYQAIF
jgi:hypothetical protein